MQNYFGMSNRKLTETMIDGCKEIKSKVVKGDKGGQRKSKVVKANKIKGGLCMVAQFQYMETLWYVRQTQVYVA